MDVSSAQGSPVLGWYRSVGKTRWISEVPVKEASGRAGAHAPMHRAPVPSSHWHHLGQHTANPYMTADCNHTARLDQDHRCWFRMAVWSSSRFVSHATDLCTELIRSELFGHLLTCTPSIPLSSSHMSPHPTKCQCVTPLQRRGWHPHSLFVCS